MINESSRLVLARVEKGMNLPWKSNFQEDLVAEPVSGCLAYPIGRTVDGPALLVSFRLAHDCTQDVRHLAMNELPREKALRSVNASVYLVIRDRALP